MLFIESFSSILPAPWHTKFTAWNVNLLEKSLELRSTDLEIGKIGALERIRPSDLCLGSATPIDSQLICKQASIDDA